MSEHMPKSQLPLQEVSALDYAKQLAEGNKTQQELAHDWVGAPGEVAPEAAADMASYLENRPATPARDALVHFGSKEAHGENMQEAHYKRTLSEQKTDKQRSLDELIDEWAEADSRNDQTRSRDIQDALLDSVLSIEGLADDDRIALLDGAEAQKGMRAFPKDLAYDLATALNEYTGLAAARGRSTLTPGATKAKVEASRERYEALRLKAKEWEVKTMKARGLEQADRVMVSKLQDKTEAKMIALGIKFDAERLAEPKGVTAGLRKKFYDWWARQGGGATFKQRLWGNVKKSAVVGAASLPFAVAAGISGVIFAGPLVGAAVAAGAGRGVARGLMRSHIEKNSSSKTVAASQMEKRLAEQYENIENGYVRADDGEIHVPASVTGVFAEGTKKDVQRNRRRTLGAMALGAVAGAVGGHFLGDLAHNALWGGGHHPSPQQPYGEHSPNSTPPGMQPQPPKPEVPSPSSPAPNGPPITPEHGLTGQEFKVEHGSGIIREIQEYADSHNYHIKPGDADRIYHELYQEHGSQIIDLKGPGPDTYVIRPGDLGLTHSGEGSWYPGIEDELRDMLAKDAA